MGGSWGRGAFPEAILLDLDTSEWIASANSPPMNKKEMMTGDDVFSFVFTTNSTDASVVSASCLTAPHWFGGGGGGA